MGVRVHDHDGFYTLLIPKAIDTWLLPYQGLLRIMRSIFVHCIDTGGNDHDGYFRALLERRGYRGIVQEYALSPSISDNTLARSKKPMKDDMAECFSALTSLIDVAVITGGKYALLKSQVVERLTGQANRSHLHLMPTSGTRYYRWGGSDWAPVFAHDLSADDRAKAYESLERNAREQGIWLTHVWGERIEDRGSRSHSPH